ncbi:TetR/AcrR family transcriptional regulator [Hominifimenecus sp. rT4P-3]|uniref:TetR/AcrR family transcriptional regulator n=1 Tax=Hominifimenecus sp. rT4P-3 TaxID=3242979 RepID=UPI003DA2FDC0
MRQNRKTVSPMSNEGRNTYVMEHITKAFLTLLEEKGIEDISISELCDNAGVGRASFYRNFNSKSDILRAYINKLFDGWKSDWEKNNSIPFSSGIGMIFEHFEQHRAFYRLLNERHLIYLLKDVILDMMELKPGLPKGEAYAKAFVAYSLYGWIEVWFQRGMQESSEEMRLLFQNQGR